MVSDITFPDFDLNVGHLGGVLEWMPPDHISQVTHYDVYFWDELSCQKALAGVELLASPEMELVNVTNITNGTTSTTSTTSTTTTKTAKQLQQLPQQQVEQQQQRQQ
jgi:hypothetical protein